MLSIMRQSCASTYIYRVLFTNTFLCSNKAKKNIDDWVDHMTRLNYEAVTNGPSFL